MINKQYGILRNYEIVLNGKFEFIIYIKRNKIYFKVVFCELFIDLVLIKNDKYVMIYYIIKYDFVLCVIFLDMIVCKVQEVI